MTPPWRPTRSPTPAAASSTGTRSRGALWLSRFTEIYDKLVWINPTPQETWEYSTSVAMTQDLVDGDMFPLTIRGLEEGMNTLSK